MKMGQAEFTALIASLQDGSATVLDLTDKLDDAQAITFIEALAQNKSVKSVSLSRTPYSWRRGDKLSLKVCEALATTLKTNKALRQLKLNGHFWGKEEMSILAPALASSPLQDLEYAYNWLGMDEGAEALAGALPKMQQLRRLNLSHNCLSCRALETLATGLEQSPVEVLDLSWQEHHLKTKLDKRGVPQVSDDLDLSLRIGQALSRIISKSPLLRLNLSNNELDATSVEHASACKGRPLYFLNLAFNKLGNAGFQCLSEGLIDGSQVADLNLFRNNICDEVEVSATHKPLQAQQNPKKTLTQDETEAKRAADKPKTESAKAMLKAGQHALANFVKKHQALRKLDLGQNGILDQGLQILAPALPESPIVWLGLSGSIRSKGAESSGITVDEISIPGMRALIANLPNTALTGIDADYCYDADKEIEGPLRCEIRSLLGKNQKKIEEGFVALKKSLSTFKAQILAPGKKLDQYQALYKEAQALLLVWELNYPEKRDYSRRDKGDIEAVRQEWIQLGFTAPGLDVQLSVASDGKEKREKVEMTAVAELSSGTAKPSAKPEGDQAVRLLQAIEQLTHTAGSVGGAIASVGAGGAITFTTTPAGSKPPVSGSDANVAAAAAGSSRSVFSRTLTQTRNHN